jgi:hypothetical protein
MSIKNVNSEISRSTNTIDKTSTCTLTSDEVKTFGNVVATHANEPIAVTFPTASAAFNNLVLDVAQGGAASVSVVAGGKTATIGAVYNFVRVKCIKAVWYFCNATVGA